VTAGEADDLCAALGNNEFGKANYNKFHKNCVDFARALAAKLGSEDVPSWCYRGQAIGKALGLGGPDPEDSYENGLESGAQSPAVPIGAMSGSLAAPIGDAQAVSSRKPQDSMSAAIELASKSLSGTYVAPPPMPAGPLPGSLAGTYVAPPIPVGRGPSYVAPPLPHLVAQQLPPTQAVANGEGCSAGSRVSVLQNNRSWATGKVICQGDDSRFTILYDTNWSTEVNVEASRIVPLPPQQQPTTDCFQASMLDSGVVNFQGLASADSILEPLSKQGKSLGGIAGGIRGRVPTVPSFPAPASPHNFATSSATFAAPVATQPLAPAGSFSMGGFPPKRVPTKAVSAHGHPLVLTAGVSPYPQAPTMAPRGRDTLGATWRY
jgi:hypothetical protein